MQPDCQLIPARLRKSIQVSPSGCWMWTACTNALGYGRAFYEGRTWNAHRLIYTPARGPVPATLQVDHLCKVRGCVNPEHLEAVSRGENNRRSDSPSGRNARKTHCAAGHPLDARRTDRRRPSGVYRTCSTCLRGVSA